MTESLRTPSTPGVSSGASFPSSRGASESYSDGTHRKVAEHDCFSPIASSSLSQATIPSIQPAYDFWTVIRVMQTFNHACISCAQDSESLEAMEDYETASKALQSVIDQYSTLSRETRSALDVGIEAWTVTESLPKLPPQESTEHEAPGVRKVDSLSDCERSGTRLILAPDLCGSVGMRGTRHLPASPSLVDVR
ncbi:hypothetical protein NMY22_g17980 [Coprinellus aureogranulatus]|nr:hypothetical protein NMY22_g17980 [Coprinellus aureogranulatus]